MFHGARILVAPLDWGLGHAARCVPVIQALLEYGAVPVIGADNGPMALLRAEFPHLEHVRIPGMQVRYSPGRSQAWAMAKQLPRMLRQVREEHRLLASMLRGLKLDAVISDQRFGMRSSAMPSVLITHQLFPFSPFAQGVARWLNRGHITRFNRCWVADHAHAPGLSGHLSHGGPLPPNASFIGPLSRFTTAATKNGTAYRVVAVISGPEPQRTLIEQEVRAQLHGIAGPHLLLTGRAGQADAAPGPVRVEAHLPAHELQAALVQAELIIGRTGYSTIMDLEAIGRGALLVPTPGQPEQEYLARLHAGRGLHRIQHQGALDVAAALQNPPGRSGPPPKSTALFDAMADLARLIKPRPPTS